MEKRDYTRVIESGILYREDFEREYLKERYLIQQEEEEWYNEQSRINNSNEESGKSSDSNK